MPFFHSADPVGLGSLWSDPDPEMILDKNLGKNLSQCGKFNDIDAKHKQKSGIFTVREVAKDKWCILCWKIYHTARDFYRTAKKISCRAGTGPGHVPG
jgi:hypothetical protein